MKKITRKHIFLIIAIILIISFVAEAVVLLTGGHGGHGHGGFLGRDIIFGFCGAWVLILVAKKILAPLIQKDEDYYGGSDD